MQSSLLFWIVASVVVRKGVPCGDPLWTSCGQIPSELLKMSPETRVLVFSRPSEVGVKQFYFLEEMEIKVLLKFCWNIQAHSNCSCFRVSNGLG